MSKSGSQWWKRDRAHPWWQPNPEHQAKLAEGVEAWNRWREENPAVVPVLRMADLNQADLQGADLANVDFTRANLYRANLSQARLYQAEFFSADLRESNLSETDLRGAKFHLADLRGANLQESDLFRVDFISTKLSSARLNYARCMTTSFADVDLSEVLGLEEVMHTGPSGIDISTLYKLKNPIPRSFLNGAGVPDNLIEIIPTLVSSEQAAQFYSCFISYSTKDEEFAKRLYSRMQAAHLRVWFAAENIKGGQKLHEQIDRAIKVHDKLLIVLSESSLRSEWVITEIRKARRAETKEGRRKLFPIRLVSYERLQEWECFDADSGKDLAVEVREYFIPDFSNWHESNSFTAAFEKLLGDLRAEDKK